MPKPPMTAEESQIWDWLKRKKFNFDFHSRLLGARLEVGIVAPFLLGEDVIVDVDDEEAVIKAAIARTQGYTPVYVDRDKISEELEEIFG